MLEYYDEQGYDFTDPELRRAISEHHDTVLECSPTYRNWVVQYVRDSGNDVDTMQEMMSDFGITNNIGTQSSDDTASSGMNQTTSGSDDDETDHEGTLTPTFTTVYSKKTLSRKDQRAITTVFNVQLCRHFNRKQGCKHGDQCRFQHEDRQLEQRMRAEAYKALHDRRATHAL